jgi:hypothetical protein
MKKPDKNYKPFFSCQPPLIVSLPLAGTLQDEFSSVKSTKKSYMETLRIYVLPTNYRFKVIKNASVRWGCTPPHLTNFFIERIRLRLKRLYNRLDQSNTPGLGVFTYIRSGGGCFRHPAIRHYKKN